jgi:SAM-dependent methyltransferase
VRVLARLGRPLEPGARVLDLGCGDGELLAALRGAGLDAAGCDFAFKSGPCVGELERAGALRLLPPDGYRLPFEDASFDAVISDQVLEHVRDLDATAAEVARVLEPAGATLHVFPASWTPIEPHTYVPLATRLRARSWLWLWARLGVRNEHQHGLGAAEVAHRNAEYLRSSTFYRPRRAIRAAFARRFDLVGSCEGAWLEGAERAGLLIAERASLGLLSRAMGVLRTSALFARSPLRPA